MKLMGDLHWHYSRVGLISSNGRFGIQRLGTSFYVLRDRENSNEVRCSRLKAAKGLAERIRVEELDEIEERERLARR